MSRPRSLDTATPVRALLAASGLTQAELAAGDAATPRVTQQSISKSASRGAGVSVETLERLCRAAGGSLRISFVPGDDGAP